MATVAPLVDYSDEDSDVSEEEHDAIRYEDTRTEYTTAPDETIPGVAVFARGFIEHGTTVVQIPPHAVLSYRNVFGVAAAANAGRDQTPQQKQQHWPRLHPTTASTSQHGREARSRRSPPPATGYGRSAAAAAAVAAGYATSSSERVGTGYGYEALFNRRAPPPNIDQGEGDGASGSESPNTNASLALSLALLNELAKGETSRWWGYLQSLPVEEPPLAIFWDEEAVLKIDGKEFVSPLERTRRETCRKAKRRIAATQLDRYLCSPAMQEQLIAIQAFFTRVVLPFLESRLEGNIHHRRYSSEEIRLSPWLWWARFRRAYTLVSSRAFWVDAYHGLALVPVADAFNHAEEHHVHLETDWEVCGLCGALDACAHDLDDDPGLPEKEVGEEKRRLEGGDETSSASGENPIVHSLDMVCDRAIQPGEEVFNTYNVEARSRGPSDAITGGISNVELLCRYGFVIEGNEADSVFFDEEEVRAATTAQAPNNLLSAGDEVDIEAARAVFKEAGLLLEVETSGLEMAMDADGAISTALWTRLAWDALPHTRIDIGNSPKGGAATALGLDANGGPGLALVKGICDGVVRLCEGRLGAMGNKDDEYEDEEMEEQGLLTVVGRYVRGERALLQAAVQLWSELGHGCNHTD